MRAIERPVGAASVEDLAEGIIGLYRRHAMAWTTARGTRLFEGAWLDRFCSSMPVGAHVLDIGCGSGLPIARHLVGRGYDVTGIDGAPEMIALFKKNLPGQSARVADMRSLNLGRRFSGVLAWDSFFHLSPGAQRRMFAIFRNHAEHGAALMFTSGPRHGSVVGSLEGERLFHASLAPAEYRQLLGEHGFQAIEHVVEDPHCEGRTIWLARMGQGQSLAEKRQES